jgi:hypothetical protein
MLHKHNETEYAPPLRRQKGNPSISCSTPMSMGWEFSSENAQMPTNPDAHKPATLETLLVPRWI